MRTRPSKQGGSCPWIGLASYIAHPDYGVWADKKRRYETGDTLSQSAYKKFAKFVDSQRKEYKRETSLGVTLESIKSKVCIDVLPPRVG